MSIFSRGQRGRHYFNNRVWAVIIERVEVPLRENKIHHFEKILFLVLGIFSLRCGRACMCIHLLRLGDLVGGWAEDFSRDKVLQCGRCLQAHVIEAFRVDEITHESRGNREKYFKAP